MNFLHFRKDSVSLNLTAFFAMLLILARAVVQAVTIDEAETYLNFVAPAWPSHWYPSSNNHILNSMLMRLFTSIFGTSHLTVRAPALIGAAVYISVAHYFCKLVSRESMVRWSLFVCLVFNPLILDHLVAARGYSLATAFLMCAICIPACKSLAEQTNGPAWEDKTACMCSSVCAALSFCANFSFGIANAVTLFAIFLWTCHRAAVLQPFRRGWRAAERIGILACCTLPGLLVAIILAGPVVLRMPRRQLWYGAESLGETFSGVVNSSLYELNPYLVNDFLRPVLETISPFLFPLIGAACIGKAIYMGLVWSSVKDAHTKRLVEVAFVALGILIVSLSVHWLLFKVSDLLLPRERTAIFVALLSMMAAGAVTGCVVQSRVGALLHRAGVIALCAVAVYFLFSMRLTYFKEWKYGADVERVYAELLNYHRVHGVTGMASHWRYASSLNFYRRRSGVNTMPEFEGGRPPYPLDRQAYILWYPEDSQFIEEQGLEILYKGDMTDVVIGVRPVTTKKEFGPAPAGIYDDRSQLFSYSGRWLRGDFWQSGSGTITYTKAAGARLRLNFKGTQVTYSCTKAFNRGMASVKIDGRDKGVIDLYSAQTVWRAKTTFRGLAAGSHTIVIEALPRKNSASSDFFIDVDSLEVR